MLQAKNSKGNQCSSSPPSKSQQNPVSQSIPMPSGPSSSPSGYMGDQTPVPQKRYHQKRPSSCPAKGIDSEPIHDDQSGLAASFTQYSPNQFE